MIQNNIAQQLDAVRAAASRLVADLAADQAIAAPFLQTVAALSDRLQEQAVSALDQAPTSGLSKWQQNATYRLLFDSIDEGFCIIEVMFADDQPFNYRFIDANPAFEHQTGITNGIGRTIRELAPDHERHWYEIYGRIALTGEPMRFEAQAEALHRWYDVNAFRVGTPAEHLVAVLFNDITRRKQAEEALRTSQARQAFLLLLSDRLRSLADPAEIQYQAARTLGEYIGASRVGYAEDQGDGATISITHSYNNGVPDIEGRYHYDDYGPALLQALKVGQTVIRNDIAADPTLTDTEKAAHAALDLGATLNIPLVKAGRLVAVLFIHHRTAHVWSPEEITLLQETAERTWAAVERARAESTVRESQARLRAIADLVPDLLWSNDPQGRADWRNQGWLHYTGQSTSEAEGLGWLAAVHPDEWAAFGAAFDHHQQQPFRREHRLRRHDGAYRWFLIQARPVYDQHGTLQCWYGAATDIHDERAARTAAEAAVEARDQFLSVAAHELKTPLTSLLGHTQVLQRRLQRAGEAEPRTAQSLALITAQALRLNRLIDTLLDVARINMGRLSLERAPLDLGALLTGVVDELSITLSRRTINVATPPESCIVEGDSLRLEQVIVNLVQNAVKYSLLDSVINITLTCTAAEAQIHVHDHGIGIPAAAMPHLFERFYRVEHASSAIRGMGIGLSVVQDIVTLHGGTIHVESTEGIGSTFTVSLPRIAESSQ